MISIILLVALHPVSAIGGAKTYDLNILLDKPHLFSEAPSPNSPQLGSGLKPLQASERSEPSRNSVLNSLTIFGGVMTDNEWEDIFTPNQIDFRDSGLIGIAVSRKIWDFKDTLSVEIEGQVVRYFGDQDNWEFNLPLVVRWHVFPWDKWLDTSFAFGIGPSYASEIPKEEIAREGSSERWLVYLLAELEFGVPSSLWSGIFRLHHRSGAFGIVADDGGSNVLTAGIRRHF